MNITNVCRFSTKVQYVVPILIMYDKLVLPTCPGETRLFQHSAARNQKNRNDSVMSAHLSRICEQENKSKFEFSRKRIKERCYLYYKTADFSLMLCSCRDIRHGIRGFK